MYESWIPYCNDSLGLRKKLLGPSTSTLDPNLFLWVSKSNGFSIIQYYLGSRTVKLMTVTNSSNTSTICADVYSDVIRYSSPAFLSTAINNMIHKLQ